MGSLKAFIALSLGLAALAAACGGSAGTAPPTATGVPGATPGTDYASLRGDITIDGSSTVFPITEAVSEEFGKLTKGNVKVTVGISGTGGGFKKFCNGETLISDASRPISSSEVDACAKAGIEYIELPVAIDGLTVVVNPQNKFLSCIKVSELKRIWEPAAEGKITRWTQVNPAWPDAPIRLYGPGTDSGTFDYFTEVINGKAKASRGDYTASENDNVLVQGVVGDRNALGYFGYAYYVENKGLLKEVAIDNEKGKGCMLPTDETIHKGDYAPLARPLFIYVRKDAATRPHVQEFVRFYLSVPGRELVQEVGYTPFPTTVYSLTLSRFENGKLGTLFGGAAPQQGTVEEVLKGNQ